MEPRTVPLLGGNQLIIEPERVGQLVYLGIRFRDSGRGLMSALEAPAAAQLLEALERSLDYISGGTPDDFREALRAIGGAA
jgi:hypothetical protein